MVNSSHYRLDIRKKRAHVLSAYNAQEIVMATKEYAVFPVRAGTKGPWMVYSSTIQAEGLEAVRGKTMKSFNRHLAQALPEGVRVAVIDRRLENPHIVIGCRPTAA